MPKATRKPKPKKMTVRVSEPPIGWCFDLRVGAPRNPDGTAILVKVDMSGPGLRDGDPLLCLTRSQTVPFISSMPIPTLQTFWLEASHFLVTETAKVTFTAVPFASSSSRILSHELISRDFHVYIDIICRTTPVFKCLICSSMIHHPLHRVHNFEESLAASYPTQPDNTKVYWATAWKGLKFPNYRGAIGVNNTLIKPAHSRSVDLWVWLEPEGALFLRRAHRQTSPHLTVPRQLAPESRGRLSARQREANFIRDLRKLENTTESDISAGLLAKLRKETRQIRNLQLVFQDMEPLLEPGKKIPGTTLDAYCASLQAQCEANGNSPSWCMFSSWLAVLVSGKSTNKGLGTKEEHIASATTEGTLESILARSRWIIPLSGGRVTHWVLAWVDYGAYEVGIFDSIPELGSSSWAEPLLLKVVDAIREYAGVPKMEWDSGQWKRALNTPDELERQLDAWSCGLFVAMAAKSIVKRLTHSFKVQPSNMFVRRASSGAPTKIYGCCNSANNPCPHAVLLQWFPSALPVPSSTSLFANQKACVEAKDSYKDEMRKEMLEVLVKLPFAATKFMSRVVRTTQQVEGEEDDEPVEVTAESLARSHGDPRTEGERKEGDVEGERKEGDVAGGRKEDVRHVQHEIDPIKSSDVQVNAELNETPTVYLEDVTFGEPGPSTSSGKRPRKDQDPPTDLREEPPLKKGKLTQGVRAPKKNEKTRKQDLLDDEWCSELEEKRIKCRGCNEWIRLQGNRKYDSRNWLAHKNTCPQITGKTKGRRLETKKSKPPPPGVSAISSYFSKPAPTAASSTTPSIAGIFPPRRPGDPLVPKYSKPDPVPPLLLPCKNLRTAEYKEYIFRTQTRSLGGVSLEFRARAIRQLLPWKPHPELKLTPETKDSNVVVVPKRVSAKIPDGCNDHIKYHKWTAKEKAKVDEVLRAWARWEVDYVNGCVRSTQCHGTTQNVEEICDACVAVSEDSSFQHSVRKVMR
ncbi:hypothetical protein B0H10DRAFT_2194012 [Mycena sp. CBHHK59/15]|nr:hypothetical protein B0H10DRAFT_2194012 [Mycena sp. CBHHK59/15]